MKNCGLTIENNLGIGCGGNNGKMILLMNVKMLNTIFDVIFIYDGVLADVDNCVIRKGGKDGQTKR